MEKMAEALRRAVCTMAEDPADEGPRERSPVPGGDVLREAACEWAAFCLRELNGRALVCGLSVSRAVADFLNELEDGTH